ncbi:hypothetical protein BN1723_014783 [Verticillium longisporum]|uniref:Uncharacterized protein n=1 Tax=Verticillium longisporum TaxID=100787 RepID=A0A0G4MI01_VERLO|nr:hypothetical protein BN1723_014783 [Verticillium longisporum]
MAWATWAILEWSKDVVDRHAEFADEITVSAAETRAEGTDAVTVARLDENTGLVCSGNDLADDGTAANDRCLLVLADGHLV